jgi:adenylate kinase
MLNLILFGPPGAGKGTQAKKIAEEFKLMHVSTGDILRAEIAAETPLGLQVKAIMGRGELVSDEILIEILRSVIEKSKGVKGFIFDGFPRTIPQAEALDKMLTQEWQNISAVISLEVGEEELVRRLLNRAHELGRADDTEAVIRNRLMVYDKHTSPLLDFYKVKGLLKEIQGTGGVDAIFGDLCRVIREVS